ncbi:hypothetical protein [Alcanivorax sediminis]|uniref:Uncharacterized protein n=1 Tax=Alcanivorax sediminis TaxID=2663008 RepID=A0A6N7LSB6_9GAMM|nr:hypothetical protein [Alcanivorax sediminis]MQX51905.1 hypothetical protein [Alcanivorax sediminis]
MSAQRKVSIRMALPIMLLPLAAVAAAESASAVWQPGPDATSEYLREEQSLREQERLQDHRDAQREQSNARQQDLHNRIQHRRDDMIREMNRKP